MRNIRTHSPTRERTIDGPYQAYIQHQAIAERAFLFFLARGARHGSDLEDWYRAELELLAEYAGHRQPSR